MPGDGVKGAEWCGRGLWFCICIIPSVACMMGDMMGSHVQADMEWGIIAALLETAHSEWGLR